MSTTALKAKKDFYQEILEVQPRCIYTSLRKPGNVYILCSVLKEMAWRDQTSRG